MTSKIDREALTVQIDRITGNVRVDGMLALRAFKRDGTVWLQFCDRDRMRSRGRRPPTRFIEVCLQAFWEKLNSEIGEGNGNTS